MIPIANKEELSKIKARYSHLEFMKYCWQKPFEPLVVGMHTKEICRLIDEAQEKLKNGESTFLLIKVHFRAGKSDIVSRFLPPHFLAENPDKDVMVVGYAASLAEGFSRFSRNLIRSPEFQELYPNTNITGGIQSWGIENHIGVVTASGLTSGITGKGYTLGICDDYLSDRASAESAVIRNTLWEHFTNDFLTRRSPTSITIVLATPWHVDDIIGRIESKIDPTNENYDPNFPPFKVVSFPAKDGEVDIGIKDYEKYGDRKYHIEHIHYDYLFPERYSKEWYEQQFASLGEYSSAGLLQCRPTIRGGNLINTSKIKIHTNANNFPNTKYYRVWDLAHTEKQTQKADPDWTSGTLLTYVKENDIWHLWIKDVARIRANAPERDNFIRAVAEKDGMNVTIAVENSIESKDAFNQMQYIFNGRRVVRSVSIKGDKVARMSYVEPIFEAGNVNILSGSWNLDWLKEVKEFPSGKHDDQIDNMSAGYQLCCLGNGQVIVGAVKGW